MHVDPILKTKEEIGYMREAGRILRSCHQHIEQWMVPGITTAAINERVEEFLAARGATPEQKGIKDILTRRVPLLMKWSATDFLGKRSWRAGM